jgi:SMC interacting uncharacterized protein involved in chromosome segregation
MWAMLLTVSAAVAFMSYERHQANQRLRDLEVRLTTVLAGYKEQRAARRELYAARLEIERLKANLGALQRQASPP